MYINNDKIIIFIEWMLIYQLGRYLFDNLTMCRFQPLMLILISYIINKQNPAILRTVTTRE